jgi:CARDB
MMQRRRGRLFGVLMTVALMAAGLAVLVSLPEPVSAYSDIEIQFDHPAFAGKSQVIPCRLVIDGGPAGDLGGNFTYKAEIVADNTTGSSVSPSTKTSQTGIFTFNVTMPGEAPQTIKIKINATSKASTKDSTYKVREYQMEVVDPIQISATVYNTGAVDAVGVTARFYADGTLLGTQTFDVSAGSSTNLLYNWTWMSVSGGKHVVTVTVDDPNGIVEFSDGNNVYTMTVYVGDQGNPVGAVLTVGVIIMAVLVTLTFMQKPARRKK